MTRPPRMRPDFRVRADLSLDEVTARLAEGLTEESDCFAGQVLRGHALLHLPPSRRSLHSPVLNLELEEIDGSTRIHGRFGPQPNVWTGFIAVFAVLGLLGFAGLIYGLAQLTASESPWGLLAVPAAAGAIAFVYGAAFIGQGLSVEEMCALRSFVDRSVFQQLKRTASACGFEAPRPDRSD